MIVTEDKDVKIYPISVFMSYNQTFSKTHITSFILTIASERAVDDN